MIYVLVFGGWLLAAVAILALLLAFCRVAALADKRDDEFLGSCEDQLRRAPRARGCQGRRRTKGYR